VGKTRRRATLLWGRAHGRRRDDEEDGPAGLATGTGVGEFDASELILLDLSYEDEEVEFKRRWTD
jgi:hypothetical protein